MNSLKKLKMKKVILFSSKEDLKKAFSSLEQKTAQSFKAFAQSKQEVQEMARLIYLD
ncbi:MAG: hypothetical protein ACYDHG_04870 [Desulfomonilaceae bacterium]